MVIRNSAITSFLINIRRGEPALTNKKPGSNKRPTRTKEVTNQVIRLRFLDPFASAGVIAQKLNQAGYKVSIRSVERTITEFGLQKKHIRSTLETIKGSR